MIIQYEINKQQHQQQLYTCCNPLAKIIQFWLPLAKMMIPTRKLSQTLHRGKSGGGIGGAGMRNVTALGVVSFFTDFSTEMVLGVLPLFIVSSLGASRALLGAIEGSAELTSYAFRMVSGSLSDKVGKEKPSLLLATVFPL